MKLSRRLERGYERRASWLRWLGLRLDDDL